MNKISKSVYDLMNVYKKAGIETSLDAEAMIKELTENSYKNNAIENLVNIFYGEESTLDISNFKYVDDYEIITKTMTDADGNEYSENDEDVYNEYVEKKAKQEFEGYKVVAREDDGDICFDLLDTDGEIVDTFDEKADAEEYLDELIEEFIEDEPDFDDLDYEYDEIYWNTVYQPEFGVDIDSAQDVGLGVLEFNNGDQYLFLRGCGMDMSFQFVKYYAYANKALPLKYIDKLEWTKMNSSKEEFKHILTCLGVDVSKLSNL